MQLAAVLIAKNEAPYLVEWVAHHRALGFDRFLIYDNESTDDTPRVLETLSRVPGLEAIKWSVPEGYSPQQCAYSDALKRLRGTADYAAFIDADEFLIPHGDATIKGILADLERFPDFGGLAINQILFGHNEQEHFSLEPVMRRFPVRGRQTERVNLFTKTIFRLAHEPRFRLRFGRSARWREMRRITRYNASGRRLSFGKQMDFADALDLSKVQLNHYFVKSREEFEKKRRRGGGMGRTRAKRTNRHKEELFDWMGNNDAIIDEATLPFAEAIEMRMREIVRG
ncbi:hypothetical protein IZ6_18100 [Terrihabitans soli]|uniref:Glycosyltransferase family 2 protein n=1 Tax=Terrihabitans soli TaxID=708113 RepID=A0A6S6QU27_9HYPH|nr:glycosyltransferase family 2 protein [Terrihabitans soli]BCJ91075.1 hypothetical protein IZ6_18100 [Terrihabitans soli]